jgi:hypothetical protein
VTLFGDLDPPGDKEIDEKHSPVSKRKLILYFSTVITTLGFSVCMVITRAWMEGPGTCHCLNDHVPDSVKSQGQHVFQWIPLQMGHGPGGCLFFQEDSLQ